MDTNKIKENNILCQDERIGQKKPLTFERIIFRLTFIANYNGVLAKIRRKQRRFPKEYRAKAFFCFNFGKKK